MFYFSSVKYRAHYPRLNKGFTLVELATTLIVVSLLLVGRAKASQLVDIVRERRIEVDFGRLMTAINAYQDKFKAIPGDDSLADRHLSRNHSIVGNGNGQIEGNWNDLASTSEASRVWLHLRLAGLLDGTKDISATDYLPVNAMNRPMGIQRGNDNPMASPIKDVFGMGIRGTYIICSTGIPGRFVQSLDQKVDDGDPSTGSMLATLDNGPAYTLGVSAATLDTGTATDIDPNNVYIVCKGT